MSTPHRDGYATRCLGAGVTLLFSLATPYVPEARAERPREVLVVNAPHQPVPVTGTLLASVSPHRQPYQRDVSIEVPAGALSDHASFTVPAGKRLVIELVSGSTRVHAAELVRVNVRTSVGGTAVTHTVAPSVYRRELPPGVNPDFIVTYSQPLPLYADPGTTVTVTATRSENAEITPTFFALALSGYLVACGPEAGCPIP